MKLPLYDWFSVGVKYKEMETGSAGLGAIVTPQVGFNAVEPTDHHPGVETPGLAPAGPAPAAGGLRSAINSLAYQCAICYTPPEYP